jgi:hypothetical protein
MLAEQPVALLATMATLLAVATMGTVATTGTVAAVTGNRAALAAYEGNSDEREEHR